MTVLRGKGRKKLKTTPIVPQVILMTPSEVNKLHLSGNWDQRVRHFRAQAQNGDLGQITILANVMEKISPKMYSNKQS